MATVVKDFKVKNGLIVEGTTGTINNHDILTKKTDDQNYIIGLIGGTATSTNTANAVVKRDANGNFAAGEVTADLVGDVTGNADTATTLETARTISLTGDVTGSVSFDGSQNVSITATVDGSFATDSEVATAKSEAISAAESDATSKANAAQAAAELTASNALSSAVSTLEGQIADAETDANTYTDNAITALNLAGTYDALGAAAQALTDANEYTDEKIADLVDSAPAMLDTLNELAAAIADNPNYATDVANLVATKADTSYVDSEISDLDTAAQGYASTAQTNAQAYADGLAVNYDAAGAAATAEANANSYTDGVASDILDGTSTFAEVNINNVSKEFAATTGNIATAAQTTAYHFNKSAFRSAKFLVKIKNGTHTEVSEVLLTLDTADNVYLTEYGMSSTSGASLGTITADTDATHVRIRVTPANNNSEVMVAGTLLI